MNKGRAFCFTLNNYTKEEEDHVQQVGKDAVYLIYGREIGEGGTPHLQGYIHFQNGRSFDAVKRLLPRAHVEKRRGTIDQAVAYCSKDQDIFTSGTKPKSNKEKGAIGKEAITKIINAAESGDMEWIRSNHPRWFLTHHARLTSLRVRQPRILDGDLTNEWWVGATGSGKSRTLWERYPVHYHKQLNKWWDGYNDEEVVAIEEWCPKNECTGSQLKIWADRYPFSAQIKGGTLTRIRPDKIIILSNYELRECFPSDADFLPLQRRFRVVRFASL